MIFNRRQSISKIYHYENLRQSGFSLFELTVVIIIISFLVVIGYRYYFETIEDSQAKVIQFQANTFSRSVANIRGKALANNSTKVNLDSADKSNIAINVNEFGWPANTDARSSPKSGTQTANECAQLWQAIFKNAPPAKVENDVNQSDSDFDYVISAIDGNICRYRLSRSQDGLYFFDYYLKTGTVLVSVPNN